MLSNHWRVCSSLQPGTEKRPGDATPWLGRIVTGCRERWTVAASAEAQRTVNWPKAKPQRIALHPSDLTERMPLSTLSSPAILSANHAAPCRQALSRMLLHPLGELRRAHQAGLHRDLSEVRGGDGLLVAIRRRGETTEHGDDLDHDRTTPSTR